MARFKQFNNLVSRTAALFILFMVLLRLNAIQGSPITVAKSEYTKLSDLYNLKSVREDHRQSINGSLTCGYPSCPEIDPMKLNVHIVAHTHDDVGWLKTVDQYYYGTSKFYSHAGVQSILDSLIPQLVMDREKRFIYVEMSFFVKWWEEQDEKMRAVVRRLVDEGRLEFTNGGWCMNDEATVTYHSTIEQMTLGLKFLNETFGQCGHPKVGWQIDPFGHTNEQASLFAQFGFDGMFFTRIDYLDKAQRTKSRSLDLIWHGDRALPSQSGSIFTNIFRDGYDAPTGFCFDSLCNDDVIVDNKDSYEYNIEERGNSLISFIRSYANSKLTNQLLIPFGGDFQYTAAGQNFKSLDKLMRYIRDKAPDMNIFYSTPSCYQYAVHQQVTENNIRLPEKYDDFMPYDSSYTVWWSGYFTSRPSVKLTERETANLLQVSRLVSLSILLDQASEVGNSTRRKTQAKAKANFVEQVRQHELECLGRLWRVLGDLQHHDAITGTEKQHVADDYLRRANEAAQQCVQFIGANKRRKVGALLDKTDGAYERLASSGRKMSLDPIFLESTSFCSLNISQCPPLEIPVDDCSYVGLLPDHKNSCVFGRATTSRRSKNYPKEIERKGVLVTVYNPLASQVKQFDIRLPCIGLCELDKVQVIHVATNETLKLTRLLVPSGVEALPFRTSTARYEILFYANIPALGSTSFLVSDYNEEDLVDDEYTVKVPIEFNRGRMKRDDGSITNKGELNRDHSDDKETEKRYEYMSIPIRHDSRTSTNTGSGTRNRRRRSMALGKQGASDSGGRAGSDRVVVKFDMQTGMIVGLRRVSDGSYLELTQKFGFYYSAKLGNPSGAYIFRPNSSEPDLLQKPATFKMLKRNNGTLIEIHQKWMDWIWQTIRVDATKNYIEFDYVVGPIANPSFQSGREVITRYITNMHNSGIFYTDSNGRQMLPRSIKKTETPEDLGGSFFPVVSSMIIRSIRNNQSTTNNKSPPASTANRSAEAVAILVDRPQAATSLNEGNLEFIIHRRHMRDDNFGVSEPLDEPGEDGRGLVTRGKHRLYLKFQDEQQASVEESRQLLESISQPRMTPKLIKLPVTPRANVTYEHEFAALRLQESPQQNSSDVYLVYDQFFNDLRQESIRYALKPVITFDRLRVSAQEFMRLVDDSERADFSLLNTSLPNNIHLLTLQPWNRRPNELLIRFENLDNPLTLSPFPSWLAYNKILGAYKSITSAQSANKEQDDQVKPETCVDVEYLFKRIRIVSLEEYNLGANVVLDMDERLDWTEERNYIRKMTCDPTGDKPTTIRLAPRQIRTFLATYEFI